MELRHLRYFVAVAEEQNVTRAAARLHVSQPPLTRQIHDLEHELGFMLFARTGKALQLTDAGRVFLAQARRVLTTLEEAITTTRATAIGGGELKIGFAPSPTIGLLPKVLGEYQQHAPAVKVCLHDMSSPEMLSGLRTGKLDIALIMAPTSQAASGITFEPLRSFAMVAAMANSHVLAKRTTLALTDVFAEPIVTFSRDNYPDYHALLRRIFGGNYRRLRFVEECDTGMSLVAAVESGKGIAIVIDATAATAGKRLTFVPLSPTPPRAVLGVAYLKSRLNERSKDFLQLLRRFRDR